jgi:hypothetical protein
VEESWGVPTGAIFFSLCFLPSEAEALVISTLSEAAWSYFVNIIMDVR